MALTPEEKAARARDRMTERARCLSPIRYAQKTVSPIFQQMIRAEAAAKKNALSEAVRDGTSILVFRRVGQCVCVTCGKLLPWKDNGASCGRLDTGHFLAGRTASILFEETNAHPQCVHCNQHLSGNQANYEIWMRAVYGQEEIDRLRRLKNTTRKFTHEEVVDLKIQYAARLKAAEETIRLLTPAG